MSSAVQKPHVRPYFFAIFLAFSGLLAVSPSEMAQAQPRYGRGEMRDGVQPLDRLLPGIRRNHPRRIL